MVLGYFIPFTQRRDDDKISFTAVHDEQVAAVLGRYVKRELTAEQTVRMLELKRSQFFEWVKRFEGGLTSGFTAGHSRKTPNYRISREIEEHILDELRIEKSLIDDSSMPVRFNNYRFVSGQIMNKYHEEGSARTIIDRAKKGASILRSQKGNITIGR